MSIREFFDKKKYKQPTLPEKFTLDEAMEKILEPPETVRAQGFDPALLHCHGCANSCLLTKPRCAVGERVAEALLHSDLR